MCPARAPLELVHKIGKSGINCHRVAYAGLPIPRGCSTGIFGRLALCFELPPPHLL